MARWRQRTPRTRPAALAAAAVALALPALPTQAQRVFGFEGFDHGETIPMAVGPISIKALNPGGTLTAFNTALVRTGLPDLEGPAPDGPASDRLWTLGNLPPETLAGVVVRAQGGPPHAVDPSSPCPPPSPR
ncbi:MAG: hypothetical protein AAF078_04010 [Planctomycetota bacterium]